VQNTSTYKRRKTESGKEIISGRTCGHCRLKGHYSTACPSNPNRSHAAERRGCNRDVKGKRGRPSTKRGFHEDGREERVGDETYMSDEEEMYNE
jgi:hypothetical protein